MKESICIGVESTAHTIGFGIVDSKGEVLANENRVYVPSRGGIHPREAAQHHSSVAIDALASAIEDSGVELRDLDVVAFSQGPGLGPCLRSGATIARALALSLQRPIVGVNHMVAHIEIGRLLTKCSDPIILYVAGGNTILSVFEAKRYRVLGETLDIAAGNCLDSFAIEVGLKQPYLPSLEQLADQGNKIMEIPYVVKGMDMSFSGVLTAAVRLCRRSSSTEDICKSLLENVCAMLTEVTERALAHYEKKEVLLTGGTARSRRLREMLSGMVSEHDASLSVVPPEFAGDNGAMIAWTGLLQFMHGDRLELEESIVKPRMRLDETRVLWGNEAIP